MIPYWLVYAFVLLQLTLDRFYQTQHIKNTARSFFGMFTLVLLIGFASARGPHTDNDYANYKELFYFAIAAPLSIENYTKDPAFFIISNIAHYIGIGYIGVFSIFAAISLISKFAFFYQLKDHKYFYFFIYLFFCRFYLVHDLTQIRAGTGIGLASLAIAITHKNSKILSITIFISSILFHISTALMTPIFIALLFNSKFRSKIPPIIIIASSILFLSFSNQILETLSLGELSRISPYMNGEYQTTTVSLISIYFILKSLAIFIALTLIWNKLEIIHRVSVYMTSIGLFFQLGLSINDALSLRAAEVFSMFDIVTLILPLLYFHGYKRLFYTLFITASGLVFFISSLKIMGPYNLS